MPAELLLGHTINTDAAHVARALSSLGIDLHHACVVGDNAARLEECLRAALQRSDLVITTGGLGPTNDDLTKETVARVLGLPLDGPANGRDIADEPLSKRRIQTSPICYSCAAGCGSSCGGSLLEKYAR